MPVRPPTPLLRTVRRRELLRDGGGLSDSQLLDAFVSRRDEDAFAALVRRHGPLVLGVCRRVLGHADDAEDAFQAAFLVLARRAAEIGRRERLAGWLHGVARRTALEARQRRGRRRARESDIMALPAPSVEPAQPRRDIGSILDAELSRLPEELRLPIVLCDLEGRRRSEAARELGLAAGALAYRLTRGRQLLAERLTRRGVVLSAAALGAALSAGVADAGVSAPLLTSTVRAALAFAAGGAAAPAHIAAIARGAMTAMFLARLKSAAVLTMVAALIIGAGLLTRRALADERRPDPPPARPAAPRAQPPAKPPEAPPAGRIVLHKDLELLSFKPDGSDLKGMARLAASDLLGYQPHSARLSPDGKRIAFGKAVLRVDDNGNQGAGPPDTLFLRDADKAAEGTALIHVDGVEMNNWAWSPDGARIALLTWDKEHSARNWIVDVKNKDIKELPLPKYTLKDKEYTMAIQDWSPDGKWFLAAGNGLHLVKADGTDPKRLTEAGNIFTGTVRFAPDSRRALFVAVEDEDKGYALRTVDFASRKVRTLAEGKNFAEIMACWSPDGRRVAYAVRYKDENNSGEQETTLFTVDADGANTVTVMTDKRRTGFVSFVLMAWR